MLLEWKVYSSASLPYPGYTYPEFTEVICSHQWWDGSISITCTVVGSVCHTILPYSISKYPDVLLRTAIHYSHTTDIGTVNCSCVADFCHITLMFSFELLFQKTRKGAPDGRMAVELGSPPATKRLQRS